MNIAKEGIRVIWQESVPQEIVNAVDPIVRELGYLLPPWVEFLRMHYMVDQEIIASTSSNYDYRNAQITISGSWLQMDEEERKHVIMHEMAHILTGPYFMCVDNLLEDLEEKGVLTDFALAHIRRTITVGMEATVEDIGRSLRRKHSQEVQSHSQRVIPVDNSATTTEVRITQEQVDKDLASGQMSYTDNQGEGE